MKVLAAKTIVDGLSPEGVSKNCMGGEPLIKIQSGGAHPQGGACSLNSMKACKTTGDTQH